MPKRPFTPSITPVLLVALALALGACGGGGGSAAPAAAPAAAAPVADTPTLQTKTPEADPSCPLAYPGTTVSLLSGPDPLVSQQWHLKNTGQFLGKVGEDINIEPAWALSQGEGVRIALVDDALEVVHPDLLPNVVPDASFNYRPAVRGSVFPLPCTAQDSHGTSVAGIIASRAANAIGTVGIAPKAQLVGYNPLSLDLSGDVSDALNRGMDRNAIYNNSWGSPDTGELNQAEPEFAQAIDKGLRLGRQGRGSIFVFPGGNGGCYSVTGRSACQADNANFDGYVNRLGTIAIGAVDQNGRQPWYGESGANLWVSAPAGDAIAGITTTAIRGAYRSDFVGTSASAPMATGVIALMLSVNPSLTWRDVPIILARSARRNHPADPGWVRGFNHKYGFGVIDAAAAVQLARQWISVGDSGNLKQCTVSLPASSLPIDDAGQPLSSTLNLAGCAISAIEHVSVQVQIEHGYSGDLAIELGSPGGSTSVLSTPRYCLNGDRLANDCGEINGWQFGSVRHLDEAANGTWTLSLRDAVPGIAGQLRGWTLTVYGR